MRHPVLRSLIVAAAVLAGTVGFAAPSHAMVRAVPDSEHVAVGSFWVSFGGRQPFFICTGTLVSSTVFVTAGHCVDYVVSNGGKAFVSFAQKFPTNGAPPADLVPATAHLNPRYKTSNGTDLYQFDVSVLTLAKSSRVPKSAYGVLPTAGLLDQLKANGTLDSQTFTLSGYGTSSMVVDPMSGQGSPISFPDTGQRLQGTLGFSALSASVLHENQRANAGFAGAGYGDSGGPTFLGTSNIILGVTSTGDIPCYTTNTAYRLDTQDARDFLGQFVDLP